MRKLFLVLGALALGCQEVDTGVTVEITKPQDGDTLGSPVPLTAELRSPRNIRWIYIQVDTITVDSIICEPPQSPYYLITSVEVDTGAHLITVIGENTVGDVGSDAVEVVIE